MARVVKLISRGRYSYAIPLVKADLMRLGITDPKHEALKLSFVDGDQSGMLLIQSEKQAGRLEPDSALVDFFNQHPEIKDRRAYLKKASNLF